MNNLQKALVGAGAVAALAGIVAVTTPTKPQPKDGEAVKITGEVTTFKMKGGIVAESVKTENALVAVGIRHLIRLMTGDSASHYDTAAFLGIGNDSTATDTSMTGLQGDSLYIANVDSVTYGANYVRYWITTTTAQANFRWREYVLYNDSDAIALDRATTDHGKKTTADTWICRLAFTFQ
jgi:hypothetical protein